MALNESGFPAPGGIAVTPDGMVWVAADPFSIRGIGPDNEPAMSFYDRCDPPGTEPATRVHRGSRRGSAHHHQLVLQLRCRCSTRRPER